MSAEAARHDNMKLGKDQTTSAYRRVQVLSTHTCMHRYRANQGYICLVLCLSWSFQHGSQVVIEATRSRPIQHTGDCRSVLIAYILSTSFLCTAYLVLPASQGVAATHEHRKVRKELGLIGILYCLLLLWWYCRCHLVAFCSSSSSPAAAAARCCPCVWL